MTTDTDISAEGCAAVQVRLEGPLYIALENWRRSQPKIPARSEALRALIERALANPHRHTVSELSTRLDRQ
jgi:hypothetical protein